MSEELMPTHSTTPPPGGVAQILGRIPRTHRMVAGSALLAVVVGLGMLVMRDPTPQQAVLFAGLAPEEAASVVQKLQADKVAFELDAGGTVIKVAQDKVHELRITLAGAGLPTTGGVGFEVFDEQTFGTTSFVEQLNYRRALEGELARTIVGLEAVDRARVHISMGEKSLYKSVEKPPTASIMLKLQGGARLGEDQIRGIVHLVASSVAGLSPDDVIVVDQRGKPLSISDRDKALVEQNLDLETALAARVTGILERMVGADQIAVTVTAELTTEQVERTEELYDQGPQKTAIRSETRQVEGGPAGQTVGGAAGSVANLPGAPGPETLGTPGKAGSLVETRNYEVNRIVQRTVGPKARIDRLHVAVLVGGVAKDDGEIVPRSAEELASIEALAREAAGIVPERGDRIEVHSVPFAQAAETIFDMPAEDEAAAEAGTSLPLWAAIGAGAVLVPLALLAAARRRRRRERGELVHQLPMHASLEPTALAAGMAAVALPMPIPPVSAQRLLSAVQRDTQRAALAISSWLADAGPTSNGNGR